MAFVKELLARFTGDTSDLEASSKKASAVVASFAAKTAAASVAAAGGFAILAVKQSHAGDELGKLTDKYGVSTEAISRNAHAADLAGVSVGQLATSYRFMQNSIVAAIQGSDAQAKAFKTLGLSARDLINLKPEEAYARIADALSKIENPALRSTLAVDLFGRAGADLLPMFKEGAEGLKAAADEADRFGLTINRIDAGQLEAANDAVTKVGAAANGAARQFAVGLAPSISTVLEHLLKGVDYADSFRNAGASLGAAFVEGMALAETAIDQVALALLKAKGYAMLAAQQVAAFYGQDISGKMDYESLDTAIADVENRIAGKLAGSKSIITEYNTAIENAARATKELGDNANKAGAVDIPLTAAAMKAAADAAKKAREEIIKQNNENADALIRMKDDLIGAGNAWQGMKKMALNALNEIGNNLIRLASGGTSGGGFLGSIAQSIFGAISGGFSFGGGASTGVAGVWGGGPLASFDTGTNYIHEDQIAMLHKGEKVSPARQVVADKNNGATAAGNTNIYIQTGVAQTVRAEMARIIPSLRAEAVRAVFESQSRGIA